MSLKSDRPCTTRLHTLITLTAITAIKTPRCLLSTRFLIKPLLNLRKTPFPFLWRQLRHLSPSFDTLPLCYRSIDRIFDGRRLAAFSHIPPIQVPIYGLSRLPSRCYCPYSHPGTCLYITACKHTFAACGIGNRVYLNSASLSYLHSNSILQPT